MRIISGTAKGRNLVAPKGNEITRPALAKVREAIFSSLGDVEGCVVLDIFAGTGSLGLEALSRGAAQAYFVENHPLAIRCLIENLKKLKFSDRAKIFDRKLPLGLARIKLDVLPQIIFCDPPYDCNLLNPTLQQLVDLNFVDSEALVIVEHTARECPQIKGLQEVKKRQYGQTFITYLKKAP